MVGRPRLRRGDTARVVVAIAWLALVLRAEDKGVGAGTIAVGIALVLLTVGVFFYEPADRHRPP